MKDTKPLSFFTELRRIVEGLSHHEKDGKDRLLFVAPSPGRERGAYLAEALGIIVREHFFIKPAHKKIMQEVTYVPGDEGAMSSYSLAISEEVFDKLLPSGSPRKLMTRVDWFQDAIFSQEEKSPGRPRRRSQIHFGPVLYDIIGNMEQGSATTIEDMIDCMGGFHGMNVNGTNFVIVPDLSKEEDEMPLRYQLLVRKGILDRLLEMESGRAQGWNREMS